MANRHIYKMGLIGNCSYLAYIDQEADVKWQCWPRFDSSFIFGGLLDKEKGGHFFVKPCDENFTSRQYYLENTNVLVTEFKASDGSFRVIDFAPRFLQYGRYYKPTMLMRKVEVLSGSPKVRVGCVARGEYGEFEAHRTFGSNHIRFLGLEDNVRLTTNIPLHMIASERSFLLMETKYLVLTWGTPLEAPLQSTVESFLDSTIQYWRGWVEGCTIPSVYQDEVIRSSLVLKLHQYEDSGAIIASGTTSLPEAPKEGRNWDYRYFWVRDTYYTLQAFNQVGHFEELDMYSHFLQNIAIEVKDRFQPMYTILGNSQIDEKVLKLSGYLDNQPVRIGNAAYHQVQNDVYGQVILSLLPLYIDKRIIERRRLRDTSLLHRLLEMVEKTMDEPDSGLWELRNRKLKHSYTFLFHWAGSMAAYKVGEALGDKVLKEKAEKLAILAKSQIESCYSSEHQAYLSFIDGDSFDAALFQMIQMGYFGNDKAKALAHLENSAKQLRADGSLFYRYRMEDDFGKPNVAFLVCGFWYAQALANLGKVEEAQAAFSQLLSTGNHLGLLSEDVDHRDLSQWGNFVQTYSHVGVINVAFEIDRALNKPTFL